MSRRRTLNSLGFKPCDHDNEAQTLLAEVGLIGRNCLWMQKNANQEEVTETWFGTEYDKYNSEEDFNQNHGDDAELPDDEGENWRHVVETYLIADVSDDDSSATLHKVEMGVDMDRARSGYTMASFSLEDHQRLGIFNDDTSLGNAIRTASTALKFASSDEALQYLADVTGKQVRIADADPQVAFDKFIKKMTSESNKMKIYGWKMSVEDRDGSPMIHWHRPLDDGSYVEGFYVYVFDGGHDKNHDTFKHFSEDEGLGRHEIVAEAASGGVITEKEWKTTNSFQTVYERVLDFSKDEIEGLIEEEEYYND
jgi:hypothetical protein